MDQFRERSAISKNEFSEILETDNPEATTRAIMDAVEAIDDPVWLAAKLMQVLKSRTELWVVGTSIVALTELALFNPDIDPDEILSIIEPFAQNSDFKDWVDTAIDDLRNLQRQR